MPHSNMHAPETHINGCPRGEKKPGCGSAGDMLVDVFWRVLFTHMPGTHRHNFGFSCLKQGCMALAALSGLWSGACGAPNPNQPHAGRATRRDVSPAPALAADAQPETDAILQPQFPARAARAAAISDQAIGAYDGAELPEVDPACEGMITPLARIDPTGNIGHRGYFDLPVPHILHRVAGSPAQLSSGDAWAQWAAAMGWAYQKWQPEDEIAVLSAAEVALVADLRGTEDWATAANLAAYHILAARGGLFVADNVSPPTLAPGGAWADLDRRLPLTGLLLSTHAHFRDVGLCSITATPRFMASAAGHPLMAHLAATVGDNVRARRAAVERHPHPRYLAGSAFLSRNLTGVFHLVTYTYLAELNMWPPPFPELSRLGRKP